MVWISGAEQVNVIILALFFQDDVIGQRQPPAKYDSQLSFVAQDTAVGMATTSKSGNKVSTGMDYCLTYFRNQYANYS